MKAIKELSDKLLKEATSPTPNPQLMEILYLSTMLIDKIHQCRTDPDENFNYYDWYDDFDKMQTDLSEFKAKVGKMTGHLLSCDLDDLINPNL